MATCVFWNLTVWAEHRNVEGLAQNLGKSMWFQDYLDCWDCNTCAVLHRTIKESLCESFNVSCACRYQLSTAPVLEKILQVICFGTFVETDPKGNSLFLDSTFSSIDLNYMLMPVLYDLDYCGFTVSLKSGSVSPPTLLSFYKIVFCILGSLHFQVNFRFGLPISAKTTGEAYIVITLNQ